MDKEMSRKILFDKKADASKPEPQKQPRKEKAKETAIEKKSAVDLLEWLKAHDLIKIRTLCLKAEVDPGSFHRWMNVNKEIPKQAIEKIIPILKEYGFNGSV